MAASCRVVGFLLSGFWFALMLPCLSLSLSFCLFCSVVSFFSCLVEEEFDVAPFPAAWPAFIAAYIAWWLCALYRGAGTPERALALLCSCFPFALPWLRGPLLTLSFPLPLSLPLFLSLSGVLCLSSLRFFLLVLRACNLLLHGLLLDFFCRGRRWQRVRVLACI